MRRRARPAFSKSNERVYSRCDRRQVNVDSASAPIEIPEFQAGRIRNESEIKQP